MNVFASACTIGAMRTPRLPLILVALAVAAACTFGCSQERPQQAVAVQPVSTVTKEQANAQPKAEEEPVAGDPQTRAYLEKFMAWGKEDIRVSHGFGDLFEDPSKMSARQDRLAKLAQVQHLVDDYATKCKLTPVPSGCEQLQRLVLKQADIERQIIKHERTRLTSPGTEGDLESITSEYRKVQLDLADELPKVMLHAEINRL